MKRRLLPWLMLLPAPMLAATDVVIYRCTDVQGGLTVQNMPCPKGMQQTHKVMQPPEASPHPSPAAPATPVVPLIALPTQTPVAPLTKPPTPALPLQPLPPLFQCEQREGERYFSDVEEPPSRCVALRVTGLDGNPATGAGDACEVVRDLCSQIPEDQACGAWQQRAREAETRSRFARPENAARNQREFERLQRLIDASSCGR